MYSFDKAAVEHSRLRLGLSALNHQRFKYNLTPDPICNQCGSTNEDVAHFFFDCITYAPHRQLLFMDLQAHLAP